MAIWRKIFHKFIHHKVALLGLFIILFFYFLALFAPFVAPYSYTRRSKYVNAPPQLPHFFDEEGTFHIRPFIYGLIREVDPDTLQSNYTYNFDEQRPLRFFVHGDSYLFLGLFKTDIHLFGVSGGDGMFLFGTDEYGRDLFSRVLMGGRISLTIGLVGVFVSIFFGTFIGLISGFFGGRVDEIIQRLIEILMSFPALPLWMALAAMIPAKWSSAQIFLAIATIMGLLRWTGVARQIRGKVLSLREQDYISAAAALGASNLRIIFRHLLPNIFSLVLVFGTLEIPKMILAESSLSFLGLGIQPPMVSWGSLLSTAMDIRKVLWTPWVFIPGLFIVVSVLGFNFIGDGLRDAADPFK